MSHIESVRDILNYLNHREFQRIPPSAATVPPNIEHPLHIHDGHVFSSYAGLRFGTLFQTIVDFTDSTPRIVAHEALLSTRHAWKPHEPDELLPMELLFAQLHDQTDIVYLDRLARTLHALNFLAQGAVGDLHLNVHPHHLLAVHGDHGHVFEQILQQCGLTPSQIVLEIPEHTVRDKPRLQAAIRSWQSRKYRIAIDNFGSQHRQLSRVLDLAPNFIKLNASLSGDGISTALRRLLEQLATSRQTNMEIIATGIDTAASQTRALDLGIHLLQGNYWGIAQPLCIFDAARNAVAPQNQRIGITK